MYTDIDDIYAEQARSMLERLPFLNGAIAAEATALQMKFREQRQQLQEAEYQQLLHDNPQLIAGNGRGRVFSPLCFGVRTKALNIEIYWFSCHLTRDGRRLLKYIPKGHARQLAGYYMPGLLRVARRWERDLVARTELAGNELRRRQNDIAKMRKELLRWESQAKGPDDA